MKKKFLACAIAMATLSLVGCGDKTKKETTPKEYLEVYSPNDVINIYGIQSEKSYSLKDIRFHVDDGLIINGNEIDWTKKDDSDTSAHIADSKIIYDGIGRTSFEGKYGSYTYQLNVSVNSREDVRYVYEFFNVNSLKPASALQDIDVETSSFTLDGMAGTVVRVDYPIDEGFGYNYTIEADFEFLAAVKDTRYSGMMFRINRENPNVWYQMDVRKNIQSDNNGQSGIECTEQTGNGYVYPDRNYAEKPLPTDRPAKFKVVVENMRAQFYIDEELMIDTVLNNVTDGNIGFQVASGKVRFSNVKITMGSANIIHTGVGLADAFSSKVQANPSFPVLSPNYKDLSKLAAAYQLTNTNLISYSVKAGDDKGKLVAKTFKDETIVDLATLLQGYRGNMIANILVDDVKLAKRVADLTAGVGADDSTILSKDPNVLNEVYKYNPNVRLAYISSASAINDYKQASAECFKAGEAHASIVVLDTKMITRDAIHMIASRGYGAWAINFDETDTLAPYKATLAGAYVFISTSEEEALKAMDSNVFNTNGFFRKPAVTGHRGDGANMYYPENSKEAIKWADEQGAIAVEIDIHLTKDGEILINHNYDTTATSNCSLTIANATLSEIKQCRLKRGAVQTDYTFPTLQEAFEILDDDSDLIFVIEIKATKYGIAKKLLEVLKEYDMLDRCLVIDFSLPSLNYIKRNEPGLHVGYLYPPALKTATDFANDNRQFFNKGIGFSPVMTSVDETGIKLSGARGINHWVWTFNPNQTEYMRYFEAGNVGFTTNRVDISSGWKIRLNTDKELYETTVGQSVDIVANSETYKGDLISETNYLVKVVSGSDVISVTNGNKISGIKKGTAYVVIENLSSFDNSGVVEAHSIYSNLIRIDVK